MMETTDKECLLRLAEIIQTAYRTVSSPIIADKSPTQKDLLEGIEIVHALMNRLPDSVEFSAVDDGILM